MDILTILIMVLIVIAYLGRWFAQRSHSVLNGDLIIGVTILVCTFIGLSIFAVTFTRAFTP